MQLGGADRPIPTRELQVGEGRVGRGTRSPQASLGPPPSPCKEARAGGVSGRPSAVPPRAERRRLRAVPSTRSVSPQPEAGADDSPCCLIAALKNFALGAGEAGVAATGRRGSARACRVLREHTSLPATHLARPGCGDSPRARGFVPFTRRASAGAGRAGHGRRTPLASGQSRTRVRRAPRAWGPRPPARQPSAREAARPFRGAPRVCVGLTSADGCGQEQVARYF